MSMETDININATERIPEGIKISRAEQSGVSLYFFGARNINDEKPSTAINEIIAETVNVTLPSKCIVPQLKELNRATLLNVTAALINTNRAIR